MKTPPTLSVVAGFAYTLQHITWFEFFQKNATKHAYLFSFELSLRDKYLGNLMSLVLDVSESSDKDIFLAVAAKEYIRSPIVCREEFFALCPEYFSTEKISLPEDGIACSTLTDKGKSLGEEVCNDHFDFFKRLMEKVWTRQTTGKTDASCGITFTSHE